MPLETTGRVVRPPEGYGAIQSRSPREVIAQWGTAHSLRTDGQYSLHYSQWGAANPEFKHRISAESPFGGEDTNSKWAKQFLAELADGLEAEAVEGYPAGEDRPSTVVEPNPRATDLSLDEIVADHLDSLHHEAFFVVSTTFEVTAYRMLWFGLQYDSEIVEQGKTVGNGAFA